MSENQDQLTPTQTAHLLAQVLGETPTTWQTRLQNWRVPGRSEPLKHHREPGRRPFYRLGDVQTFADSLKASRAQALGNSAHMAEAVAVSNGNAITVEWRGGGTDGRFHLSAELAERLGQQLVRLANGQIMATSKEGAQQ